MESRCGGDLWAESSRGESNRNGSLVQVKVNRDQCYYLVITILILAKSTLELPHSFFPISTALVRVVVEEDFNERAGGARNFSRTEIKVGRETNFNPLWGWN